jgi:putative oxidoreductase
MIQKYLNYKNKDLGILMLRIALGLVFVVHGYMKLTNITGTMAFFSTLNIPEFMVYVVIIIELLGGILMLAGFFTQYIGATFAIIMVVAMGSTGLRKGPFGGQELEMVLLFVSLAVAFIGGGRYSLETLFKEKTTPLVTS